MKKTYTFFIMLLIFLLLSGCSSNINLNIVKDGKYSMEHPIIGLTYIYISDKKNSPC